MSSNFPNGFGNGVTIRGLPLQQVHPGEVLWVNNSTVLAKGGVGGSNGNNGTYKKPFSTLEYALSKTKASRGDVIVIMPGHAETVGSATALNFDTAGVAIVGLGSGNLRPTFTLDTANTATIPVSGADMSVTNIKFVGNFLSIASCFTVAAAPNFSIENCDFTDTSAILGFLTIVTTTVSVDANGLNFSGNRVKSDATTTPGPAVSILGTVTDVTINDNHIVHTVASNNISALLEHAALVITDLKLMRNIVHSVNTDTATGGLLVKTTATTGSGIIAHNRIKALDVAAAIIITAAAVQYGAFDNLYTGETTLLSGFVLPAIATDA